MIERTLLRRLRRDTPLEQSGVPPTEERMRREIAIVVRYSIQSRREAWFHLTYEVRDGPSPGLEQWFLVGMEELSGLDVAA